MIWCPEVNKFYVIRPVLIDITVDVKGAEIGAVFAPSESGKSCIDRSIARAF